MDLQFSRKNLAILLAGATLLCMGLPVGGLSSTSGYISDDGKFVRSIHSHLSIENEGRIFSSLRVSLRNGGSYPFSGLGYAFPAFANGLYQEAKEGLRATPVEYSSIHASLIGSALALQVGKELMNEEIVVFAKPENSSELLPSGELDFELQFQTKGKIQFLENYDELVWPVTGYRSSLPIQKVTALVDLPPFVDRSNVATAAFTRVRGFVPRYGNAGNKTSKVDFKILQDDESGRVQVMYWNTAPLDPGEMYFIQIRWPKGFVKEPAS